MFRGVRERPLLCLEGVLQKVANLAHLASQSVAGGAVAEEDVAQPRAELSVGEEEAHTRVEAAEGAGGEPGVKGIAPAARYTHLEAVLSAVAVRLFEVDVNPLAEDELPVLVRDADAKAAVAEALEAPPRAEGVFKCVVYRVDGSLLV